MASDKKEIFEKKSIPHKDYFLQYDNLNSLQKELIFSVFKRYNCFAGCKICYIDKLFEKNKEKFNKFIPNEITKDIEKEWEKTFSHYHTTCTIDDFFWLKHNTPNLFRWYQEKSYMFELGSFTDNSFVRNYDIFMNELEKTGDSLSEISFSDKFLFKINIDETIEKLDKITKKFGYFRICKLIQTHENSLENLNVKKYTDWISSNNLEFSIHHDFIKFDTIDFKNKNQESAFASYDSKLFTICGETDYLSYDSFFLSLVEATSVLSKPYDTIENGFDSKKHIYSHLNSKINLYKDYEEKLKKSSGINHNYYKYFKYISENLIVNEDYNFIPSLCFKEYDSYFLKLVEDGWIKTKYGLVKKSSEEETIKILFKFK